MATDIESRIKEVTVKGKLPCAAAFMVAKEFNMTPKQVGDMANKLNIRIASCQLGCFP
jgi:hypothetical protein